MVIVTCPDGTTFYQDGILKNQIETKIKPKVQKKDHDQVFVIDGGEGSGKSVLAMQIAKTLDNDFNIERVCFTPTEFTKAIIRAKKGECVVYDEAFTGLSSRGSLSEINNLIVSLMMEMRQKNLYVLIVMPTFFLLDKYVALFRAKGLFHVYMKYGKRGYWTFFNKNKKKLLYLTGKKLYNYSWPRSSFRGRFLEQYVVDEEEYRKRKKNALENKTRLTRAERYMWQRDALIWILYTQLKKNQTEISKMCKTWDVGVERKTISDIILKKQKEIAEQDVIKEEKDKMDNEMAVKTQNQDDSKALNEENIEEKEEEDEE